MRQPHWWKFDKQLGRSAGKQSVEETTFVFVADFYKNFSKGLLVNVHVHICCVNLSALYCCKGKDIDVITKSNIPLRKHIKKTIIPRDRQILMRKRKKLKKRQLNKNTKSRLIDIQLKLQSSYANERYNQELDAISKIKVNPKFFYSYAKRFSKTKPKVGPLLLDPITNKLTDNNLQMANILQDQYKSVFTPPKS
eukprot:TCONS_00052438-protein